MNEIRLRVKKGSEYQAKEENIYSQDSFFRDTYETARDCVEEILAANEKFFAENDDFGRYSEEDINILLKGYANNLIAFCAERGQGKTSAMISFSTALKNLKLNRQWNQNEETRKFYGENSHIPFFEYEVLGPIDPTTMEKEDSILNIILSRIFSSFKCKWEEEQRKSRNQYSEAREQHEMMQLIQKAYHSIQVLKGKKSCEEDDELEQIMELGDSSNLRGILYQVINCYLKYMTNGGKAVLVIQIDDADLNVDKAYEIIEDIRKYLVMPNVIVLLAANMFQLESTIEQYYIRQYADSMKNNGMVDLEKCHMIAELYIDKVLPGRRQIHLPKLGNIFKDNISRVKVSYIAQDPKDGNEKNLLTEEFDNEQIYYQEQLLSFLRKKTGIIFADPETHLHNFLPKSMRELAHFLLYFGNMEDLEIGYKELTAIFATGKIEPYTSQLTKWKANLQKLELYLVNFWASVNLREPGRNFLKSLIQEPDSNKNSHLLNFLPDYYGREREEVGIVRGISTQQARDYRDEFVRSCEDNGIEIQKKSDSPKETRYRHASYADVYEMLNVLGSLTGCNRQYQFIYAIRLCYTICMHRLLFEQIEQGILSKTIKKEKNAPLSSFMRDILFEQKENEKTGRLYAGHLEIDEDKLEENLEKIRVDDIQQTNSWVSSFCRKKVEGTRSYRMEKRKGYKQGQLIFNIFYPFFEVLDLLYEGSKTEREAYSTDEKLKSQMVASFMILLNCDVQYRLNQELKYTMQIDEIGLLSDAICGLFERDRMKDVFGVYIPTKSGMQKPDEKWIDMYVDKKQYEIPILMMQLSNKSLAELARTFYKKKKETIRNTIKQLEMYYRFANLKYDGTIKEMLEKNRENRSAEQMYTEVPRELQLAANAFEIISHLKILDLKTENIDINMFGLNIQDADSENDAVNMSLTLEMIRGEYNKASALLRNVLGIAR